MGYRSYGNYELSPCIEVEGYEGEVYDGYESMLARIRACMEEGVRVFVFDFYPGVDREEAMAHLRECEPALFIDAEECVRREKELNELFADNLTEDRVFGVLTHRRLEDCFYPDKIEAARQQVEKEEGVVFVVGTGAGLITEGEALFYFDLARWEIQLRYRRGMSNWHCGNGGEPVLSKYKRGFFVEWRMADRYKRALFDRIDYLVDTNISGKPKMISGAAFRYALESAAGRPFRLKPYFDPGIWGGQWMRDVFGIDTAQSNLAWSFDGVPEENSLQFKFGEVRVEIPCMDLVLYRPQALLGERVHGRFGAEFPIRFDLLDTMEGENLSLQVHPLTEYIQEHFGMHYTQDESYYILDVAGDDACVYLGTKAGIDPAAMEADLTAAQQGAAQFDVERYVNKLPVKKHDHVLIPAGTVHCSGKSTMVLEISATPYIFTFKLWDWGRVGLDGKPRPIHIGHGMKNIQWERDTNWVSQNLFRQEKICREEEGVRVEWTGLHEREFIDTHRYTFSKEVRCTCNGSVHVLNLVEGAQATVRSVDERFPDFEVHYAETFIVPAAVNEFILIPSGPSEGQSISVVDAQVR